MLNCWYFPENFIYGKFLIFSLACPKSLLKVYRKVKGMWLIVDFYQKIFLLYFSFFSYLPNPKAPYWFLPENFIPARIRFFFLFLPPLNTP